MEDTGMMVYHYEKSDPQRKLPGVEILCGWQYLLQAKGHGM